MLLLSFNVRSLLENAIKDVIDELLVLPRKVVVPLTTKLNLAQLMHPLPEVILIS